VSESLSLDDVRLVAERKKRVRLKRLAQFINDNLPEFEARMEFWYGSFDRKSGRLRIPGKSREGNVLKVYMRGSGSSIPIYDHNPMEAYKENRDVASWILDQHSRRAYVQKFGKIPPFGTYPYQWHKAIDSETPLGEG
jgi:hypothetical protein